MSNHEVLYSPQKQRTRPICISTNCVWEWVFLQKLRYFQTLESWLIWQVKKRTSYHFRSCLLIMMEVEHFPYSCCSFQILFLGISNSYTAFAPFPITFWVFSSLVWAFSKLKQLIPLSSQCHSLRSFHHGFVYTFFLHSET